MCVFSIKTGVMEETRESGSESREITRFMQRGECASGAVASGVQLKGKIDNLRTGRNTLLNACI